MPLQAAHARIWEFGLHLRTRQAPLTLGHGAAEVGVDQLPRLDFQVFFDTAVLDSNTHCIADLLKGEFIMFLLFSHRGDYTHYYFVVLHQEPKWRKSVGSGLSTFFPILLLSAFNQRLHFPLACLRLDLILSHFCFSID